MSPEAQRIAIAEACGWKVAAVHVGKPIPAHLLAWERGTKCVMTGDLPDFLADLNAMHEAEKVLDDEQYHGPFTVHLLDLLAETSHMAPVPTAGGSTILMPTSIPRWNSATAAQRAEAFLRTIGKWIDD